MKKIAIILSNEIKDIDLFVPLTIWRKAKISIDLISIEKKNSVIMESGVKVGCNAIFDVVNISKYHAIYIPGGSGVERFKEENWPIKHSLGPNKLLKIFENFINDKSKYILLTSESSKILYDLKIIDNLRIAGFDKSYNKKDDVNEEVVIHDNIVSVLGYWQLNIFALEVIKLLINEETKNRIEAEMDTPFY